jgi:hypothetical protein
MPIVAFQQTLSPEAQVRQRHVVCPQILAGTIVRYNAQCGGRGSTVVGGLPGCGTAGRECWDAPWTGVRCTSGTVCVRSNEW